MKRAIAGASVPVAAVIGGYAAIVHHDAGYLTREAVVMLGVLIVAGFAFVLGIGFLFRLRRPAPKRAEIVLIPKRHE